MAGPDTIFRLTSGADEDDLQLYSAFRRHVCAGHRSNYRLETMLLGGHRKCAELRI